MKKVAFKGGLLIDGTGAEPVVNSLVLTEDDKIAYAGADKEIGPDYEVGYYRKDYYAWSY